MSAQALTIAVFARRELRHQERCFAVVSPDGERSVVVCRRQVEIVEVAILVQGDDEAPMAPVLAATRPAPKLSNTSAVNDGVPSHLETVS